MELTESYWIYALGFFAQALFGTRQLVQLYHAEKKDVLYHQRSSGRSVYWLRSSFWVYGIIRNDLVIVFGQTISYFIYIRNLQLKKSLEGNTAFSKDRADAASFHRHRVDIAGKWWCIRVVQPKATSRILSSSWRI